MNATIKLSSKYEVVIPRAAREALGLKADDAGRLIDALEQGAFRGVIMEMTLMQLTVRPLPLVADEYELLLSYFPNLELEPVSREVLLDAAAWRARHRLRTPDAILLATGMRSGTTAAVTNDDRWRVSASEGIETILLALLSG